MASRPAWKVNKDNIRMNFYDFKWNPGLAPSQKKKNMRALHESINGKTLDISTKSDSELGQKLSPFNMTIKGKPVEVVYQAAKTFEGGGPYLDMLEMTPRQTKKDERLDNSGPLRCFTYEGEEFPIDPKTFFYDYLYYQAVKESFPLEEIKQLQDYDYFTDIEFNPKKSTNTQARAAALIKLILDKYGELPDFTQEEFLEFQNEALKYETI